MTSAQPLPPSEPGAAHWHSAIPALIGPTCAGKSALAHELAQREPVAIINVDAALVYRGLDIGSAKPSADERRAVPHYMLDLVDPDQRCSAWSFCQQLHRCLAKIEARGLCPLLVGGSMFYWLALATGLPGAARDEAARERVLRLARGQDTSALRQQLERIDPKLARSHHAHDRFRVMRALERAYATGAGDPGPALAPLPIRGYILAPIARRSLDEAIAERLKHFFAAGFVDELRQLRARWRLSADSASMRLVGYRQVFAHLEGQYDAVQARAEAAKATRLLCKRQYTWMRSGRIPASWYSEPKAVRERLLAAIDSYRLRRRACLA